MLVACDRSDRCHDDCCGCIRSSRSRSYYTGSGCADVRERSWLDSTIGSASSQLAEVEAKLSVWCWISRYRA
jgi:hypothetical protein